MKRIFINILYFKCNSKNLFDPRRLYFHLKKTQRYNNNLKELIKQKGNDETFIFANKKPILNEWYEQGGITSGHYFHQDLFIAQRIYKNNPVRHIDIGSRIDGFVAHVASFRKIEVLDIREVTSKIENMTFTKADMMILPPELIDAADSISCLHALEHFGLGRYGDPIDYFGYLKGLNSINKILKSGGKFYFSVPIGEQRIEFNAHRVFSINYLVNLLSGNYNIDLFSYVDDKGDFYYNQPLVDENIKNNFKCMYGCGIFELTKL